MISHRRLFLNAFRVNRSILAETEDKHCEKYPMADSIGRIQDASSLPDQDADSAGLLILTSPPG